MAVYSLNTLFFLSMNPMVGQSNNGGNWQYFANLIPDQRIFVTQSSASAIKLHVTPHIAIWAERLLSN
jgi:hypothetical protein